MPTISAPKRACKTCPLTKNRLTTEEEALQQEKEHVANKTLMMCVEATQPHTDGTQVVCRTFQARQAKTELLAGVEVRLINLERR